MEKKLQSESAENESSFRRIAEASKGLVYISETDADISPIEPRMGTDMKDVVFQIQGSGREERVEELSPEAFFAPLIQIKDWYGNREKARAAGYANLFATLKQELSDLKVFRIGTIQIAIYVVGLDRAGKVGGIVTHAVET